MPGLQGAATLTKRHSRGRMAHHHALRAGNDARAAGHAVGVATPFALAATALPHPMRPGTRLRTAGRSSRGPRACLPPHRSACQTGKNCRASLGQGRARGCWAGRPSRPATMVGSHHGARHPPGRPTTLGPCGVRRHATRRGLVL